MWFDFRVSVIRFFNEKLLYVIKTAIGVAEAY